MAEADKKKASQTTKAPSCACRARCGCFGWAASLVVLLALLLTPRCNIYILMLADYLTPFEIYKSPTYAAYHAWLVDGLSRRPEIPMPEIDFADADRATILKMTNGYTFPVVIRNAMRDSEAVKRWGDKSFWQNYSNVTVLCGLLEQLRPNCTIGDFFNEISSRDGRPFYISGASEIFVEYPELKEMVHSDTIEAIAPGPRLFTQIFMGFPKMGSDIHSAVGINIFRQIAGRKRWWFIPPSQLPYLYASINANGFSAHTKTLVGKFDQPVSPWMDKLERYTATLEPGDILINPPFFWHGILNYADHPDDLVIGVPTRYSGATGFISAFRTDPVLTVTAFASVILKDLPTKLRNPGAAFQSAIAGNRAARGVGKGVIPPGTVPD